MPPEMLRIVLFIPVFLFSLCFHEFSHAWTAFKRGDNTAFLAGRLTLHPMAHADILGTIILPIICVISHMPFFGWAKPVPVDIRNMKYGRRDMALVAAAGPLSNILLALVSTVFLFAVIRLPIPLNFSETLQLFSIVSIQVNLMLAFFNLIPIPPLDGFNVLQGFLSARLAHRLYKLQNFANLIFIMLIFSGGFRYLSAPIMYCMRFLVGWATTFSH